MSTFWQTTFVPAFHNMGKKGICPRCLNCDSCDQMIAMICPSIVRIGICDSWFVQSVTYDDSRQAFVRAQPKECKNGGLIAFRLSAVQESIVFQLDTLSSLFCAPKTLWYQGKLKMSNKVSFFGKKVVDIRCPSWCRHPVGRSGGILSVSHELQMGVA